ncbi:MAG: PEP/pyruvate-binding domain-containing protein, partial [Desulfobacterales bacterium]
MAGSIIKKLKNFILRGDFRDYSDAYDAALVRFFMSRDFDKLTERYKRFNDILTANNAVLSILNDLQEQVSGQLITFPYFKQEVSRLLEHILDFVRALTRMSPRRYDWLLPLTEKLKAGIETKMETQAVDSPQMLYSLGQVSALMADQMGNKAARLGEAKNLLNLPVPRGIVFTRMASRHLLEQNGLEPLAAELTGALKSDDSEKIESLSAKLRDGIRAARVPRDLETAVRETLSQTKDIRSFAVRSSAIGEDGRHSFAGQYHTVLNVPSDGILDAFKEVCASQYAERVLRYRKALGIEPSEDAAMAVLVMEMVPAAVSGVLYSLDPESPESNRTLVNAVWGLGRSAVEGTVAPDAYVLDRADNGRLVEHAIGGQHFRLVVDPKTGAVREEPVPAELHDRACLTPEQLNTLYQFACLLEQHFGTPQDIEWTIDPDGVIYILQVRALHVSAAIPEQVAEEVEEEPVLCGTPLHPGVAAGPVFLIRDLKLSAVPKGSILVSRTMDPEIAKVIPLSSGLIVEIGSHTSHLATIAREFQKPAIIDAKAATRVLKHKEILTLDAGRGRAYRGRIKSLLKTKYHQAARHVQEEINLPLIKSVMNDIVPLTLSHVPADYSQEVMMPVESFQTIHDIIRFVHEVSVREVFRFGGTREGDAAHILSLPGVPMQFYVIDVGDGLVPEATFKRKISPSDVTSWPFHALADGMTHLGVSWSGPVEFNLGGFISVASRSFIRSNVTDKGGRGYALLGKEYLNFHSQLAYHFTVV